MLNVISLGAGVQSSTMALMAAAGEITPMPDCAIFADTHSEPAAVYQWLDWLEQQLPFPVYRVTGGNLFADIGTKPNGRFKFMPLPAFVPGADGRASLLNRSCTRDYKIKPIRRKVRELLDLVGKRSPKHPVVTQWIGISSDEAQRAKPAREAWVSHRFPLLDMRKSRLHCIEWMLKIFKRIPPRSSCTFCPFHDDNEWADVQDDPAAWAQAVDVDERIRTLRAGQRTGVGSYLHRSLTPLRELKFVRKESSPDLFDETTFNVECEGMCGV